MAVESGTPISSRPPRKRRWLRRVLLAVGVLLASIVAAHQIWGWYESRQLKGEMDELAMRGEPMAHGSLFQPPIPDADNAVIELRDGAASLSGKDADWDRVDKLSWRLALASEDMDLARQMVNANPAALAAIARAKGKPGAHWLNQYTPALLDAKAGRRSPLRTLALLASASAVVAHDDGDDRQAVERLGDLLFVGRTAYAQRTLLGHLQAVQTVELAASVIEQIAPDMKVAPHGASETMAAKPEQLHLLITQLLDDAPLRQSCQRAMRSERLIRVLAVIAMANGQVEQKSLVDPSFPAWLTRPLALGDARLMLRHITQGIEAASQPDWPSCKDRIPTLRQVDDETRPCLYARQLLFSVRGLLERNHDIIGEGRMAATALAIRCYAVDHGGKLPAVIDDLVGAYLPAVPLDPFATAQPLRYIANADRPIIYSVGSNGRDDGGSEDHTRPSSSRWNMSDAVFHLKRQPAPTSSEK